MAVTYTNIIAYRAKSTPDFPIADCGFRIADFRLQNPSRSQIRNPKSEIGNLHDSLRFRDYNELVSVERKPDV